MAPPAPKLSRGLEQASLYLLIVLLAWAPFPLGSNRPWSWSLLCLGIAFSWAFWALALWPEPERWRSLAHGVKGPLVLGGLALLWGVIQILPIVPAGWAHPVWQMAGDALGERLTGRISIDPWHTETELMKLASYAMAAWLARAHAANHAKLMLGALVVIGGCYAAYALAMAAYGSTQQGLFYALPAPTHVVSGPFVNRNSYATYAGLVTLCGGMSFFASGWPQSGPARGWRKSVVVLAHYGLGRGLPALLAALLALGSLIATGSRAGNAATVLAILALLGLTSSGGLYRERSRWTVVAGLLVVLAIVLLFVLNSAVWTQRLDDMAASGVRDDTRLMLWSAAWRMIKDAPLLGLGLGSYQTAYPLYADQTLHFIIDRAHNDYLELAAGWGLPAAILWWAAVLWLAGLCLRGYFIRRRNRVFPLLAVGATLVVGLHAIFDFSLQMPAIAFTYATILGLGVGQAFSSRRVG